MRRGGRFTRRRLEARDHYFTGEVSDTDNGGEERKERSDYVCPQTHFCVVRLRYVVEIDGYGNENPREDGEWFESRE